MAIEKQTCKNFLLRGKSYKDGMLLLIDHLTDQDWKAGNLFSLRLCLLKKNVQKIYDNYFFALHKDGSYDENKKHFDNLLIKYNNILLRHTTLEDPFSSLKSAENFSVWRNRRGSFATPGPYASVQRETPLEDKKIFYAEYAKISSDSPPDWYRKLSPWQKNFIEKSWEKHDLCLKLVPSTLRCVPGLANISRHDFFIENEKVLTYFRHATPCPIDLLKQADLKKEAFRLNYLNVAAQIKLSLQQESNKSNGCEICEVVIFFQSLLTPGIGAKIKSKFFSDPTDSDTQIYELYAQTVEHFQKVLKTPSEKQHQDFLEQLGFIVQDNGSLEYEGQSFAKITLLLTNHPLNALRRFGAYSKQTKRNNRNTALFLGAVGRYLAVQLSQNSVSDEQDQFIDLFNGLIEKMNVCEEKESVSNNEKKALLKILDSLLRSEQITEYYENMLRLLLGLQALLSIPSGQGGLGILGFLNLGDKYHRQLLMSTMETIIANCIGANHWIACKSGKDRTAIACVAADAAAIFYKQCGRYPLYKDKHRAMYVKIYKNLLESGHHQTLAAQNAFGAKGLIRPQQSLPDDIKLDIQQIRQQTQLASLNKPKLNSKKLPVNLYVNFIEKQISRLLKKELKKLIGLIEKGVENNFGTSMLDWIRNANIYFINGKSISALRNKKRFTSIEDLGRFIEKHLLYKVEDACLKKRYLEIFLTYFHHGFFLHVLSFLLFKFYFMPLYQEKDIVFKLPLTNINFSPLKNGVQIEEILTFNQKSEEKKSLEAGQYYFQAHCCYTLTLDHIKNQSYHLKASVNYVVVDSEAEELKIFKLKKNNFPAFQAVRDFFVRVIAFFADTFKKLISSNLSNETELFDENVPNRPITAKDSAKQDFVGTLGANGIFGQTSEPSEEDSTVPIFASIAPLGTIDALPDDADYSFIAPQKN